MLCLLSNLLTHAVVTSNRRDDGVEDRYGVLVEFEDQKSADGFYLDLNGWRFSSSEVLILYFLNFSFTC